MAKKKTDAPFAVKDWPASRVEMRKLDKIIQYKTNPRIHPPEQVSALARDMREDGVTTPILVDDAGIIIAGHGRLLAAQENKFEEYPVVIARGWTDEQKRAARIKDNQRALQSGWDSELMLLELQTLKLAGYEMPLLGFPERQLLAFGVSSGTDSEQDPEAVPEVPKKPVVRKGDLWLLGDEKTGHRLLCGDSTNADDVAKAMGGQRRTFS